VLPGLFLSQTPHENRPDERDKWIAFAGANRAFARLHGAIDASYRFYHDTFGTDAHTLDLAWFQHVGEQFILRPAVRFYDQTAADFYHYDLNQTSIIPTTGLPRTTGPFYSADFRLSAFRSTNVGLKAIWDPVAWLQLDATLEHYVMHGRDGVTPASAYVRATILTLGARVSW
jgi:hypothetical protein